MSDNKIIGQGYRYDPRYHNGQSMADEKETFEETICEQTMAARMSKLQAEYNISQKVIKELEENLKEANEVIDFYGDKKNWVKRIIVNDYHVIDNKPQTGGIKAREYQKKYPKDK